MLSITDRHRQQIVDREVAKLQMREAARRASAERSPARPVPEARSTRPPRAR